MLCLRSPKGVVPAPGLGKRDKNSLCLAKGSEMLLGFFWAGFVPAWEPDLAGGGLPRGSPAAASANATHAAWLGLMEGQHGWEEILNPGHPPNTKMCSCSPCRQRCFSYAEVTGVGMFPRHCPLPHGVCAWGALSGQLVRQLRGTAVGVTLAVGTATPHPVGLCWHPVARVPCHAVPGFQGSLVSLSTGRAQPGLKSLSSCHSMPRIVSVCSPHTA